MPSLPTTECIRGKGALNSEGYGVKRVDGVLRYRHVLAWEAVNGPVPDGYEVHHECENRWCENAKHLELKTRSEHRRHHARLTQADVDEIRSRVGEGEMQKDLAAEFGLSRPYVSRIVRGIKWAA